MSCVVILTEWNEFSALDIKLFREKMQSFSDPIFMDFRNIYRPDEMREFRYYGVEKVL